MQDNSFTDYIVYDILGHIPDIRTKKMFSGTGVYVGESIVAFIAGGELYFKSDAALVQKYTALDCHLFTYTKHGKDIALKYMSATESMLEDRAIMEERIAEALSLSNKE